MKKNEGVFMLKEIQNLKMMQHPNICRLFDFYEDEKCYYLVLELLNGGDMYDYLLNYKFDLSEARAKELSLQLAEALTYIHKLGIVHRDIKLENIIMSSKTREAVPKYADFGLSFFAGPGQK